MWWSKERIYYYINAAEHTNFHKELSKLVIANLEKDDKILELGSGLGYLTAKIKNEGFNIKALDNDEEAVAKAKELHKLDIFSKQDAFCLNKRADVILLSFFGNLLDNFDYLYSITKKKIIYITSAHSGVIKHKEDKSDEIKAFLESKNISYTSSEHIIPFDQVLKTKEEAHSYMSLTYKEVDEEKIEETDDKDFPFVIKNNKRIYIFVIRKEEK